MEKSFTNFVEKKRHLIGDDKGLAIYESDLMDQLILLCKFSHEEAKRSRPVIQAAFKDFLASYLSAIEGKAELLRADHPLLRDSVRGKLCQKPSTEKQEAAAVLIQSTYKGYKTRKDQIIRRKSMEQKVKCLDKSEAAIRIQSLYRGYQTRRILSQTMDIAPAALILEKQLQANLIETIRKEKMDQEFARELQKRLKNFQDQVDSKEAIKMVTDNTNLDIEKWLASTDDFFSDVKKHEEVIAEDDIITEAVPSSRLSMDEFPTEYDDGKSQTLYEETDYEDDWRGILEPHEDKPDEINEDATEEEVKNELEERKSQRESVRFSIPAESQRKSKDESPEAEDETEGEG